MTKLFFNAVLICVFFQACINIKIDKETRNFVDEFGRKIIFHGVNVVVKLPPYIPSLEGFDPFNSMSEEDVKIMKHYGFNLVRLGVIWESIERSEGVYDTEHLEKVEAIVNMLGKNGIYVLIDAHQDMFSRLFCGEGVPHFYAKKMTYEQECKTNFLSRVMRLVGACLPLKTFNWRYDEEGLPLIDDCRTGFLKFHQSPELTTIYASFYRNEHGIQDKFAKFWKIMASKFKSNPYVIGYDLWNEPWPGNLWSDPRSMWPGYSTHNEVLPLYRKLDQEIRSVHTDYISFFETVPFPDTLPFFGGKVVSEIHDTPAGHDYKDKQVLNLHSYCCQAGAEICANGEPSLEHAKTICPKFHDMKITHHKKTAEKLGIPLIITEFGACSDSEACYHEMKSFVEVAEEHSVSWTYWMYKPFGDHTTTASEHTEGIFLETGNPQSFKIKALTRPYVQAFQGSPVTSKFDLKSSKFNSSFIFDSKIEHPSVIYFNQEIFYESGYNVKITDKEGKDVEYEVEKSNQINYFSFKIKQSFRNLDKQLINIEIFKK